MESLPCDPRASSWPIKVVLCGCGPTCTSVSEFEAVACATDGRAKVVMVVAALLGLGLLVRGGADEVKRVSGAGAPRPQPQAVPKGRSDRGGHGRTRGGVTPPPPQSQVVPEWRSDRSGHGRTRGSDPSKKRRKLVLNFQSFSDLR
jgi:hypothetical protein